MNLPQPFNTAKPRVHRRRRPELPSAAPPAPPAVTVVSVVWIDEQTAQWNFSLPVISVQDGGGLLVGEQEPDTADPVADGVLCSYSFGVSVDDPWEIETFDPVALTFDGDGTLVVPQSGNVV